MTQTSRWADEVISFGQHLKAHPDLPVFFSLLSGFYRHPVGYRDGLDIVLPSKSPVRDLAAWAATLTDVSSEARRNDSGSLHAFVYGQMSEVAVCVWAAVPGDGFPDEPGVHEWDVTVQLQEA